MKKRLWIIGEVIDRMTFGSKRHKRSYISFIVAGLCGLILGGLFCMRLIEIEWFNYENAEWFYLVMTKQSVFALVWQLFWMGFKSIIVLFICSCLRQLFFVFYLVVIARFISFCVAMVVLIMELGFIGVLYSLVFIAFQLMWLFLVMVFYVIMKENYLCIGRFCKELAIINVKHFAVICVALLIGAIVSGLLLFILITPLSTFI